MGLRVSFITTFEQIFSHFSLHSNSTLDSKHRPSGHGGLQLTHSNGDPGRISALLTTVRRDVGSLGAGFWEWNTFPHFNVTFLISELDSPVYSIRH